MRLGELPALHIVGTRRMERTYGAAYLDVGIFGTNSTTKHLVTLLEDGGDDVLVAQSYIFKVKRIRMPGISTHLCPLGGSGIAIGPFDEIEYFLHISGHICHRNTTLLTTDTLSIIGGVLTRNAG